MKKLFSIAIIAILTLANVNAQAPSFGLKAGFNSLSIRASAQGVSASESASGFYIGAFGEFQVSDKFDIQTELQFVSVSEDGESSSVLALPIMAKINVADKVSAVAGPQLGFLLDDDAEGIKKFGIGLGAGLAFDITDDIFIDGRYVFGLNNRLEETNIEGIDVDAKFNYLQIGLGYRF